MNSWIGSDPGLDEGKQGKTEVGGARIRFH